MFFLLYNPSKIFDYEKDNANITTKYKLALQNNFIINGIANLKDKNLKNITVNGTSVLQDSIVEEILTVNGSCHINNSKLYDIKINGFLDVYDSSISGLADINGTLCAKKSKINEIHIAIEKVEFYNCIIDTLVIKKSKKQDQKIILHNSIVKKILFLKKIMVLLY